MFPSLRYYKDMKTKTPLNTKIIAAFPGTGKSHFVSNSRKSAIDLDSNSYTSGYTAGGAARNQDFPDNYISAIERTRGKSSLLFIAVHPLVIERLLSKKVQLTLVYPEASLKHEYMQRFRERGDSQDFIELMDKTWNELLARLAQYKDIELIVLRQGQFISDVLEL